MTSTLGEPPPAATAFHPLSSWLTWSKMDFLWPLQNDFQYAVYYLPSQEATGLRALKSKLYFLLGQA